MEKGISNFSGRPILDVFNIKYCQRNGVDIDLYFFQVQDQLDSLQAQYDNSFAELEFLKNKKEQSILRLRRAAILTKSLADEEVFNLLLWFIFAVHLFAFR